MTPTTLERARIDDADAPASRALPAAVPSPSDVRAVIPKDARLPSRAGALRHLRSAALAYVVGVVGFVAAPWLPLRVVFSAVIGIGLARLFGVGHEALHESYTGNRSLDRRIGYVAMLLTLHPMGPVTFGHVRLHHAFTNVKDLDPQWSPASKAEYDAMSFGRRGLERAYRHVAGLGLYWSIEIVVKGLLLAGIDARTNAMLSSAALARFRRDRLVVLAYAIGSLALWALTGRALGIGAVTAVLGGFLLPLAFAHWLIGMTTYFQHTSPTIPWHRSVAETTFFESQVEGTHRLAARGWLRSVVTGARPHAAHHVDMRVPAVRLRAAQQAIDAAFPGSVPTFTLSLSSILDTTTKCKLYDYDRHRWTDFSGAPLAGRARAKRSP